MPLTVGCPRCPAPALRAEDGWDCLEHGRVEPLWRPEEASYDAFAEHLLASTAMPSYLPWPLGPGWSVTDFACVGAEPERACATMTCCSGATELDGPVDVIVVTEEPGVGLGARIAGSERPDPGADIHAGRPAVRVRIERQAVPLWPVTVDVAEGEWDRSVLAGEAGGRWVWMVLRPASAVLLLRDDWILRDAAQSGPHLVELPFGGPAPTW
jgi:hypothetical protein